MFFILLKGVYRFANGAIYDGGYLWNRKEGEGLMVYPDGSRYEGKILFV